MTNRELNTLMHRQLNRGLNTDARHVLHARELAATRARTRHVLLPTANTDTRPQGAEEYIETLVKDLSLSLSLSLSALLVDPGLRVRVPLGNSLLEPQSDFALRRLNLCVYLVTSAYVGIRRHTSTQSDFALRRQHK
jgi:hypothetical protein